MPATIVTHKELVEVIRKFATFLSTRSNVLLYSSIRDFADQLEREAGRDEKRDADAIPWAGDLDDNAVESKTDVDEHASGTGRVHNAEVAPDAPSTGLHYILRERQEQREKHGFSAERDDAYTNDELVRAAMCYAKPDAWQHHGKPSCPAKWPWDKESWKPSEDPIRNLAKAGALIAAEIDRVLRQRSRLDVGDVAALLQPIFESEGFRGEVTPRRAYQQTRWHAGNVDFFFTDAALEALVQGEPQPVRDQIHKTMKDRQRRFGVTMEALPGNVLNPKS